MEVPPPSHSLSLSPPTTATATTIATYVGVASVAVGGTVVVATATAAPSARSPPWARRRRRGPRQGARAHGRRGAADLATKRLGQTSVGASGWYVRGGGG